MRTTALALLIGAGVAACDGGDDGGGEVIVAPPPPAPPPTAPTRLEDQFGANFGTAFRAAANTDPRDPQPGDLVGVSFTTDPIPVP
jgi:hypothetical protein